MDIFQRKILEIADLAAPDIAPLETDFFTSLRREVDDIRKTHDQKVPVENFFANALNEKYGDETAYDVFKLLQEVLKKVSSEDFPKDFNILLVLAKSMERGQSSLAETILKRAMNDSEIDSKSQKNAIEFFRRILQREGFIGVSSELVDTAAFRLFKEMLTLKSRDNADLGHNSQTATLRLLTDYLHIDKVSKLLISVLNGDKENASSLLSIWDSYLRDERISKPNKGHLFGWANDNAVRFKPHVVQKVSEFILIYSGISGTSKSFPDLKAKTVSLLAEAIKRDAGPSEKAKSLVKELQSKRKVM